MNKERQLQYDKTYMKIAKCISELSYANRNKVGCVIVSADGQLISQGFNGTPSGYDNCCEDVLCTCEWNHECCKNAEPINEILKHKNCADFCKDCKYVKLITKPEVLHAESNAISKCAKWYSSTQGATLYVTLSPCFECAKTIIQAGIKRVCYGETYRDTSGLEFLIANNIIVEQIEYDK